MEKVFNEINTNNIFVNLDRSYCYTEDIKPKYDASSYIGIMESTMDNKDEIIESLKEEGSITVIYRFTTTAKYVYKKTVIALLKSIFNKYNYETYISITKNKKFIEIELVVSREDLTEEFKNELLYNDEVEDAVEDVVEDNEVDDDVEDVDDVVDVDEDIMEDNEVADDVDEDICNDINDDVDNDLLDVVEDICDDVNEDEVDN